MLTRRLALAGALALICGVAPEAMAEADPQDGRAVSLRTVEGRVGEVEAVVGEGDLELLAVRLLPDERGGERGRELVVLLGPTAICEEIGFEVEAGDRFRARVFVEDEGPVRAQKALNLTRGRMARFRTLHDSPLWTGRGDWHGGPSQRAPGTARGPRHHGGGPP